MWWGRIGAKLLLVLCLLGNLLLYYPQMGQCQIITRDTEQQTFSCEKTIHFFWNLMVRKQLNDMEMKEVQLQPTHEWLQMLVLFPFGFFVLLFVVFFLPKELQQYDIKQILYECLDEFLRLNIQNQCPLSFSQIIHFCYDNITFPVRRNYLQNMWKALLSNWNWNAENWHLHLCCWNFWK